MDLVNDFLSEGGAGWELTNNAVKLNDVVAHLKQVIKGLIVRHPCPVWPDGLHGGRLRDRAAAAEKRSKPPDVPEKDVFGGQTSIPICGHARRRRFSCRTKVAMSSGRTCLNTSSGASAGAGWGKGLARDSARVDGGRRGMVNRLLSLPVVKPRPRWHQRARGKLLRLSGLLSGTLGLLCRVRLRWSPSMRSVAPLAQECALEQILQRPSPEQPFIVDTPEALN